MNGLKIYFEEKMTAEERLRENITESIQTGISASEILPQYIEVAGMVMLGALLNGNKILCCGNGASAGDAQYFASGLVNKFEKERPSLPALALTADTTMLTSIANDYDFEEVYAKQIRAVGQEGDILFVISTSGNSENILKAVQAGLSRDMKIVALTGMDGGSLAGLLSADDVEVRVPSDRPARIKELHLLTVHCLFDYIDQSLFPE